jgi:hypothetical protein
MRFHHPSPYHIREYSPHFVRISSNQIHYHPSLLSVRIDTLAIKLAYSIAIRFIPVEKVLPNNAIRKKAPPALYTSTAGEAR